MGKCIRCGRESRLISECLALCRKCILDDFSGVESRIHEVHQMSRENFHLPPTPPEEKKGLPCNFCFKDLPCTSRRHAEECRGAALEAGLKRVKIGNIHLLGKDY